MDASDHFLDSNDADQEITTSSLEKSSPNDEFISTSGAMRNQLPGVSSGVSVHAGFPNPAADKRLQGLDLNQLLIERPSSTFLFRIRGEEGITQGIFDGDIAIVDRVAAARPSDFVLWHDGEHFKMSRSSRVASSAITWGVITAVIHQYR